MERRSWTRSRSDFSPPTRIESVPSLARNSIPVTGASRNPIPRPRSSAPIFRAAAGWMVDMSTTTAPFCAPWITPSFPRRTLSTAAESVTLTITASAPSTAARGEAAAFAPAAVSSAAFDASRFQTVTRWPASTSRRAMARPMMPRPMNPTLRAIFPPVSIHVLYQSFGVFDNLGAGVGGLMPVGSTFVQPQRAKILIVDDDVEFGALLIRMLDAAGYHAEQALNPLKALPL